MCLFCSFTYLLVWHNTYATLLYCVDAAKNTTDGMADVLYNTWKVQD